MLTDSGMVVEHAGRASPIAVAIPTCNGARHVAETVRSALSQGDEFSILVSDDRSDDDTLNIVRREAGDRAKIEVNPERLGLAGNWGRCVALADSPFVAILHQDDLWRPGHLDAHRRVATNGPRIGLIASASGVVDAGGREVSAAIVGRGGLGPVDRTFAAGESIPELAEANPLRCSAVTFSKAAFSKVGGFDPSYRYVVDWDFWIRVARRFPVSWLSAATVDVRWHLESETHRFAGGTADLDEALRLLGREFPESPRLRRKGVRRLGRAFLNRAHVALRAGDGRLARACLARALRMDPRLVARIGFDPRLAVQMTAAAIAPGWAGRTFGARAR